MRRYDVIIAGGGVIGCSIAYRLAKSGLSVAVFDAGTAGKASIAAGGMLGAQNEFEYENPLMNIALESRAMFPDLRDELLDESGVDIELRKAGLLKVAATADDQPALLKQYAFLSSKDASVKWLEPDEVPSVESCMSNETAGAIYLEKDNQVKAPLLAHAFLQAAMNAGVHVYEQEAVIRFVVEANTVCGVHTARGLFHSDRVINAAGAWSGTLFGEEPGYMPPIIPVKGECVSVKLSEAAPVKTVFAVDGCYIVPKRNKEMLIGATSYPGSFDSSVTAGGIRSLLNRAARLLPVLDEGIIDRMWTGVRPQLSDGLPIIGAHPSIKGLYICTGHYRNGILLSPITGVLMEQYLNGCEKTAAVLAPFSPSRFQIKKEELLV
ncbi:glycine oxidase ThiO [Domibacillus mangrovi]|uniref:glycine oxidase n=1 Tax=Domibacillus mangrovi TaxID=1714354 RepID=A0A1Q5P2Q5_9BACI|nr:glycine oxidase ThiO [Domibacillus mangrovi]OKL36540.1 glycine oxidase ThiO [Domibacillus mangrovi]